MDDDFVARIAEQSDRQSAAHSIDQLVRIRDDNLLAFLQVLRANQWGAGVVQAAWEKQLRARSTADLTEKNEHGIRTLTCKAPKHWSDYNGHMNESRYLECMSEASDAVMRLIGVDADYVAAGHSYFTVETHLQHRREIIAGELLHVHSVVLLAEGKKLRLRHVMLVGDEVAAVGEHLLIHVALATRRSAQPSNTILEKAKQLA